jgi:hypothetical protein
MKILTLPRGGGKTTTLINLMTQNDDLIYVSADHRWAHNAYMMAREIKPDISRDRFLAAHEAPEKLRERTMRFQSMEVVVDEIDYVLSILLGGNTRIFMGTRSA